MKKGDTNNTLDEFSTIENEKLSHFVIGQFGPNKRNSRHREFAPDLLLLAIFRQKPVRQNINQPKHDLKTGLTMYKV